LLLFKRTQQAGGLHKRLAGGGVNTPGIDEGKRNDPRGVAASSALSEQSSGGTPSGCIALLLGPLSGGVAGAQPPAS